MEGERWRLDYDLALQIIIDKLSTAGRGQHLTGRSDYLINFNDRLDDLSLFTMSPLILNISKLSMVL